MGGGETRSTCTLACIDATIHYETLSFCSPEKLFRSCLHDFSGSGDPHTLFRFLSYRFHKKLRECTTVLEKYRKILLPGFCTLSRVALSLKILKILCTLKPLNIMPTHSHNEHLNEHRPKTGNESAGID